MKNVYPVFGGGLERSMAKRVERYREEPLRSEVNLTRSAGRGSLWQISWGVW